MHSQNNVKNNTGKKIDKNHGHAILLCILKYHIQILLYDFNIYFTNLVSTLKCYRINTGI